MSNHTKEPWRYTPAETEEDAGHVYVVTGANITGADSESIFRIDLGEIDGLDDANARRIVACVNACADIETDVLTVFGAASKVERSFIKAARSLKERADRQRGEMLSALVAMVQEPQPLGIDRESYQTALALVIKYHDNVDNPEAWAARKASA